MTLPSKGGADARAVYRPDIDGLRAVAVLGVVTYHLGLNGGGFVGVDIFFVISGFLITTILAAELARGSFDWSSLAKFYERRVRRIMPALAAMCLATYALSLVFLFPEDLIAYGRSLQGIALFVSNFQFQKETGYFAGDADEKPLLHTWSLSVEEQYYLLFPLSLWLVWRYGRASPARIAIVIIAIASIVYSEIYVRHAQENAFFSTPSRTFELLAGALLALSLEYLPANKTVGEALAVAGAALIAWAYLIFTPATSFPGLHAVIPVAGSALVIASGHANSTLVSHFLSLRPLVLVGLMSYSIYLWHWPIIVFFKYRFGALFEHHPTASIAAIFAASLVVGYLSWKFVETPFRRPSATSRRRNVFVALAGVTLLMVTAGTLLSRSGGLPNRWSSDVLTTLNPSAPSWTWPDRPRCSRIVAGQIREVEKCSFAPAAGADAGAILVLGDSHASMLTSAMSGFLSPDQILIDTIRPNCPPLFDLVLQGPRGGKTCRQHNQTVLDYLEHDRPRVSTVVLAARWAYYVRGTRMAFEPRRDVVLGAGTVEDAPQAFEAQLTETVRELLAHADKVVVIAPFPEFEHPVAVSLARTKAWNQSIFDKPKLSDVLQRQQTTLDVLKRIPEIDRGRVFVASPLPYFCDASDCAYADETGMPLFRDTNHLTDLGLARIIPLLKQIVRAPEGLPPP